MSFTSIQWTDRTWNPVTGCVKVSAGCKNCYAEKVAERFWKDRKFTDVRCHEDRLVQPLHWRKSSRVFVNSMSDLFHEDVPAEFILKTFSIMAAAEWHTFQILTKRPERMRRFIEENRAALSLLAAVWPLPNVWLGVSVENQPTADERIQNLLQTPAAKRFVSYEPALGPVDFEKVPLPDDYFNWAGVTGVLQPTSERETEPDDYRYFRRKELKLDWIIVGGESGPGARPFNIQWARDVIAQCRAANVACFVKQLGANVHTLDDFDDGNVAALTDDNFGGYCVRLQDRKGGSMEEWPADLRVREYPHA